ncbi:family 43 glycosylhydrolase [uncultured Vagococcus sp.]|uniref:glycoside hydrolase family 43 protein n=1 Tax=uncultured Vagococcus sp. TaxID=189676 RepID=UPI0028CFEF23|nr:family 43 glycosylhydrolase [uncultured Vagococcus sp.]
MKYQNPIIKGFHPDPSVCFANGQFYMVNSTFEYFPGLPIYTSKDLLNWESLPAVVQQHAQVDLHKAKNSEGLFAATIRENKGTFYVVTTNISTFQTLLFTTKNPMHGWSQAIEIKIKGIDPSLFFEGERTYLQFTGYIEQQKKAIQQVELNIMTGEIIEGPKLLSHGSGGRDVEGPHIYKKEGSYYLLAAEGGTREGHMITIFKSNEVWGPYVSCANNPILSNRDYPNEPLQSIGHGDLVQDNSKAWWLVCLGTRPYKHTTNMGRETLLYPVEWNGEWPVIHNGIASQYVDLADYPQHQALMINPQVVENFTSLVTEEGEINSEALFLRDDLSLRAVIDHNGVLLKGDQSYLEQQLPSLIGLRQTSKTSVFEVTIDLTEEKTNGGITVYIDSKHHSDLLVQKNDGEIFLTRRTRLKEIIIQEKLQLIKGNEVVLSIGCSVEGYNFSIGKERKHLYKIDASFLSNEFSFGKNTGVICGIFAEGEGRLSCLSFTRQD